VLPGDGRLPALSDGAEYVIIGLDRLKLLMTKQVRTWLETPIKTL
jgi:hypothetical protein